MIVGYRRVSTLEQSLDHQDLGDCDRVFEDGMTKAAIAKHLNISRMSVYRSLAA